MASYARGHSEIRVGILVFLGITLFIGFFLYLTDRGIGMQRSDLHVRLPVAERVRKGDAVIYLGVPVGEVRSVGFAPDSGVIVRARLKRPLELRKSTTAVLTSLDMIGGQVLLLRDGDAKSPLLEDGDTIRGTATPALMERVAQFADRIEYFTNDTMAAAVLSTVGGASGAMGQLNKLLTTANAGIAEHGEQIGDIVGQMLKLVAQLETASSDEQIQAAIRGLSDASQRLQRAAANADSALDHSNEILRRIREGEGSIGAMVNDRELHDATAEAMRAIASLSKDIKENPKRYISFSLF